MRACALAGALALAAGAAVGVAAPASAWTMPGSGPVIAEHESAEPSTGVYRMPFVDGTDLSVVVAEAPGVATGLIAADGAAVVAAASGWVRAVGAEPDAAYVWIEHANGEFTRYAGFTPAEALAEGAWVDAGAVLGRAGAGRAIAWDVAAPSSAARPLSWRAGDGALQDGVRLDPQLCGAAGGALAAGEMRAAACENLAPTATLPAGPLVVDEGSPVGLDAGTSGDPEGAALQYRWDASSLEIAPVPRPALTVADDYTGTVTLTVHDPVEGLRDAASVDLVVRNVPPSVDAVAVTAEEGGIGRVRATVADPGDDTLAAQIDWGDGTPAQAVTIAQLATGVDHGYGDDGAFPVTVTVTDDDGGVGAHAIPLEIAGADPVVTLDVDGTVAFPGGAYAVVAAGGVLRAAAEATDAGSDDLSFEWSSGRRAQFPADGASIDPPLSPFGTFPVRAAHSSRQSFPVSGVEVVRVVVADDDGGMTDASLPVIVTGILPTESSASWWLHEYSGTGRAELPAADAASYLDIVQAASDVFSEVHPVTTPSQAAAILSAHNGGSGASARAELLRVWLQFAAGRIDADSSVTRASGATSTFLEFMADAEAVVGSPAAGADELDEMRADLSRLGTPQG